MLIKEGILICGRKTIDEITNKRGKSEKLLSLWFLHEGKYNKISLKWIHFNRFDDRFYIIFLHIKILYFLFCNTITIKIGSQTLM